MKLLCVIPFYKPAFVYGGPARSIPILMESLVEKGVEVTIYTTDAAGDVRLDVENGAPYLIDGVTVYYYRRDLPGNYFLSMGMAKACSQNIQSFDVVYLLSNWGFPFLPACRAAIRGKTPYLVSPRGSFKKITWQGKFLKKWCYHHIFERRYINRAAGIHYTTDMEKKDSDWLKLSPQAYVLPNPVNLDEFRHLPERGQFRQELRIAPDIPIVLYLGRVDPDKGLNITLQALGKLAEQFPELILVIAGPEEDNYFEVLKRLADKLGVASKVIFTGLLSTEKRLRALVDADVFILPSLSENFGMSAVEAMAVGLPVIVSDRSGIADYIQKSEAGVIIPLDPDCLAEELATLLKSPERRIQMGNQAVELVRSNFAPESVSGELMNYLEYVIESQKVLASEARSRW